MEKKINIAELLKDCPAGMELYSPLCGICAFKEIKKEYMIIVTTSENTEIWFDSYGRYFEFEDAECLLFPKGKTTWDGFVSPCKFKDGDIVATDLGSVFYLNTRLNTDECYGCYVGIGGDGSFHICEPFAYKECCGFATEEEKQKLFQAIEDNGYKWNAETKTLEKLIEPKFKVGDRIKHKDSIDYRLGTIESVNKNYYIIKTPDRFDNYYITDKLPFNCQDEYELARIDKFDINTLKPFDRVLVRGDVGQKWIIDFFGFMDNDKGFPFVCVRHYVIQCIPYEYNKHLLGTTNDCDEFYKTWKIWNG